MNYYIFACVLGRGKDGMSISFSFPLRKVDLQ